MLDYAIVVSGLPASGKTTVGIQLADSLGISFLDKDDFLEDLFEKNGIGDAAWRRKLSNNSNLDFVKAAKTKSRVVLVSHWKSNDDSGPSGTPTDWIGENYKFVVELYCECPTKIAATRFSTRSRHAGHCDKDRSLQEIYQSMVEYEKYLPLKIGSVIKTDTTKEPDISEIADKIKLLSSNLQ